MTKFSMQLPIEDFAKVVKNLEPLTTDSFLLLEIKQEGIDVLVKKEDAVIVAFNVPKTACEIYNYEADMQVQISTKDVPKILSKMHGSVLIGTDGNKIKIKELKTQKVFELRLMADTLGADRINMEKFNDLVGRIKPQLNINYKLTYFTLADVLKDLANVESSSMGFKFEETGATIENSDPTKSKKFIMRLDEKTYENGAKVRYSVMFMDLVCNVLLNNEIDVKLATEMPMLLETTSTNGMKVTVVIAPMVTEEEAEENKKPPVAQKVEDD